MKKYIEIWDSTMRDGEQCSGVVFTPQQKINLALKLKEYGIDYIAIMAEASEDDKRVVKKLAKDPRVGNIASLTRMKKESIDLTIDCGPQMIKLFAPVSDIQMKSKFGMDRKELLREILDHIEYCRNKYSGKIFFGAEDSSRADIDFLIKLSKVLSGKIDYFGFADTVGDMIPSEVFKIIRKIKENFEGVVMVHFHNDRGLATANTIAAVEAGARAISGTFTGIGERTGNAALEEVIKTLKDKFYDIKIGFDTKNIKEICDLVQEYTQIKIPESKPLLGRNAFTHKAGIHFNAVKKNPENYEAFPPEEIGLSRRFVYGKCSGISALKHLFGDTMDDNEYKDMLKHLKNRALGEKRDYDEHEIRNMFANY